MPTALSETIAQYHRAAAAFIAGDPEPQKRMWSRREDVTLANPLGPAVRGWHAVAAALDRATDQLRLHPSAAIGVDHLSAVTTDDLAYIVEIERDRMTIGGQQVVVSLRVTTVFRLEDGQWRIVHRHADTVTTPRPLDSLVNDHTDADVQGRRP